VTNACSSFVSTARGAKASATQTALVLEVDSGLTHKGILSRRDGEPHRGR
jgi:hypothetical protein